MHPRGPRSISDKTVIKKTGKSSSEWYRILDSWGAQKQNHTAIARYLRDEQGVSPWWAQSLTNRYEWERGLRTQ
jgi:hypothetical protein